MQNHGILGQPDGVRAAANFQLSQLAPEIAWYSFGGGVVHMVHLTIIQQ